MSKFIKLTKLDIDLKPFKKDIVLLKASEEEIEIYIKQYQEFASHIENYCIKRATIILNINEIQCFAQRTFFKDFHFKEIIPPNNLNLGTVIQLKADYHFNREHWNYYRLTVEESTEQILELIQKAIH